MHYPFPPIRARAMQERDERLYNRVMVDDFENPHSPFLHLLTPPIHKRTMQERAQ